VAAQVKLSVLTFFVLVAADVNTPGVSHIEEVTQSDSPELIWRMDISSNLTYRGIRIPSLYPGQVWPAYTQQNPSKAGQSANRRRALH
jgi:hypothetical protein